MDQVIVSKYNGTAKHGEMILRLRDVVGKISEYFQKNLKQNGKSSNSHVNIKFKRGKAVSDFEKRFKGELGFRMNDIITIISQEDQYCWVGKLNGKTGWFPAKLVEVLDERTKFYSKFGDDSMSKELSYLRNELFDAFLRLLSHGFKNYSFVKCHPWHFIEEASFRKVEENFDSVYSKLVLCQTFNLEETEKILSAEELLYRTVQAVNACRSKYSMTLDSNLMVLMCSGLNEQVLDLWVRIWCSSEETLGKWYHPWAFIRSADCWKAINYLNLLKELPFHLNAYSNETAGARGDQPFQTGLKDILATDYLFSWE